MFQYEIEKSLDAVKSDLNRVMAEEIKKSYVKTAWNENELSIKIEKGGTSEIRIGLTEKDGKVVVSELKRNISFLHKPFIGEVEKMIDHILSHKLGARKA